MKYGVSEVRSEGNKYLWLRVETEMRIGVLNIFNELILFGKVGFVRIKGFWKGLE